MSINPRGRATKVGRNFLIAAVVLAVAATVILIFLPLASTVASTTGATTFTTLPEQEGNGVISVLLIPMIITAVALIMDRSRYAYFARMAAACIMLIGSLVSLGSIGIFYIPAAGASVTAALRRK